MSDYNNNKIPCVKNTCHEVTEPYAKRSYDQADPARKALESAGGQPSQRNTHENDLVDKG